MADAPHKVVERLVARMRSGTCKNSGFLAVCGGASKVRKRKSIKLSVKIGAAQLLQSRREEAVGPVVLTSARTTPVTGKDHQVPTHAPDEIRVTDGQVGSPNVASQLLPAGPLDFANGRLNIESVPGSHPTHHKHLIHPGLVHLGEALFQVFRHKPINAFETHVYSEQDQLKFDYR
ncbi:hypothetical protein DUNSADRAFT_17420 [Dunaliella salina]|uniref:Encoded protein n=1 Tax=Dunaliella salina TaxID=3046 RepID=A0ABQ7H024_DUNSA|nr:hypothetical protein DUNSADRAFT_17420 [Dunaliella salina]|eukprot:KAF5840203.1 hypothetical protein DUNSADRAFT_17420 [Dunaliella salina]